MEVLPQQEHPTAELRTASRPDATPRKGGLPGFLFFLLLILSGNNVSAKEEAPDPEYGYPVHNRYLATVIGTPPELQAEVPSDIRLKLMDVERFPDREIPAVFWGGNKLRYAVARQKGPRPSGLRHRRNGRQLFRFQGHLLDARPLSGRLPFGGNQFPHAPELHHHGFRVRNARPAGSGRRRSHGRHADHATRSRRQDRDHRIRPGGL